MDLKRKLLSNSLNRSLPTVVPDDNDDDSAAANRKQRRSRQILNTVTNIVNDERKRTGRSKNGRRGRVSKVDINNDASAAAADDDSVELDEEYDSDENEKDYEAYYYENDDDDGRIITTVVNNKINNTNTSSSVSGNDSVLLKLPGAVAVSSSSSSENNGIAAKVSSSSFPGDHVPNEISFLIRSYLDVLLCSVAIEKLRLITSGIRHSEYAIPSIVNNILKYNNIMFEDVTMSDTKLYIPEPLWYDIDIQNRHLHLYLNQEMYNMFCTKMSDTPVTMISGIVPLERYNPLTVHKALKTLDSAMINCAVVCDHVAQHIISELYENIDERSMKSDGADIHERYNRYGTTLHSMLDITLIGNQVQETNQTSNFLTMLGCNNNSNLSSTATANRTTIDDLFNDVSSSSAAATAPISLMGSGGLDGFVNSFSYSS